MKISEKNYIKLFKANADKVDFNTIRISPGYLNPHLAYSIGYKEAANFLVKNLSSISTQELLVYPILFLYRHHLELQLKSIIRKGRLLIDESDTYPEHHRINELWILIKNIIKKIDDDIDLSAFELVDNLINECANLDPMSTAFRYPMDKDGNEHLSNIDYINLEYIADVINDVILFLEGVYLEFSNRLTIKAELEFGIY